MTDNVNQADQDAMQRLEERLAKVQAQADLFQADLKALMDGSRAILSQAGFARSARAIFDYCCARTGAISGYVALLSQDGAENELLFLEAGGLPCTVDQDLPMPIRGLRSQCYAEQRAVYHNDFMNSEWVQFMPAGHCVLNNVLFAPLILDGKAVAIIGLANKPGDFDEHDAHIATALGDLAAIALQNSQDVDARNHAEKERERIIGELQSALQQVRRLSGLLPICASCKKIRDDNGYWEQVEVYISSHSEADFSHSLCPDCLKRLYPEFDLD